MIQDLREFPHGTTVSADICLIGAGAAGITIAQELAGSALSVCLVEGGGLEYEMDSQALFAGENVGAPIIFEGGRLRFFGGTTNHWGGRCAPLDPIDFRRRDWVPLSGWPIDRTDLDPYYARAQRIAGFSSPWLSDTQALSYLKVELPKVNEDWLKPFLWRWAPVAKDIGVRSWGRAYRKLLEDSRNVKVLLHANFKAFAAEEDRSRVRNLTVASLNGISATISAKQYVLCCGGIENARLLLLAAEQNSGGFGNQNDLVGRNFIQNAHGESGLLVSAERFSRLQDQINLLVGPDGHTIEVGLALSPQVQEEQRLLNCSAMLQYQGDPESGVIAAQDIWRSLLTGRWAEDMGDKVALIAGDAGAFARTLEHRLSSGRHLSLGGSAALPARSAIIVLNVEQAPDPQSRITLSADRDVLGLQQVKADWRLGEAERKTSMAFTKLIAAEFARLGIGRCQLQPWLQDSSLPVTNYMPDYMHYIGTTRMTEYPRDGVVDGQCAVHGMRNLHVAGSSVFPTAGHAHPTFTIVALALRLADRLKSLN
jgi:choline dehydrogenase-like flavoprotein